MLIFIFCLFWMGQDKVSPVQNQSPAYAQEQSTPAPSGSVNVAEPGQSGNRAQQDQAKAASWSDPLVILNFALFAAVLIQAGIYWKQFRKMEATLGEIKNQGKTLRHQAIAALSQARSMREALIASEKAEEKRLLAMQGQWEAMDLTLDEQRKLVAQNERAVKAAEKNAKTMDRSLVLGTRAYVGVHSVGNDFKMRRILLYIENVGKVPAKDLYVITELRIEMPRSLLADRELPKGWMSAPNDPGVLRMQIPFLNSYGKFTKLFPGGLKIEIVIPLITEYFPNEVLNLIIDNRVPINLRGQVKYSDGFHSNKTTEFFFHYSIYQRMWLAQPIHEPFVYTEPEKSDEDYIDNNEKKRT
jgi:hypothetical protein